MLLLLLLLMSVVLPALGESSTENSNEKENTTLLLVQAIMRHGEHTPLFLYKNDPNKADIWVEGLAKLAYFGKRHHYAVGYSLIYIYEDFLTTNPNEIHAYSSIDDIDLTGAMTSAHALYEPHGEWKFIHDLEWQPIPVHYLPKDEDMYLNAASPCPVGFQELDRVKSEKVREIGARHQKMLNDVGNYVELDLSDDFNALNLYDTLLIEKQHNLSVPTLLDNYFEELQEYALQSETSIYGSDLLLRLRFGPLLGNIIENMNSKINGDIPDLKFQLTCVKDIYMSAFLKMLNFENFPRPPYCSMLLFELHKMADATVTVRLLYMIPTYPLTDAKDLQVLVLDDCSEFCPLENFTRKIQRFIPEDWAEECQLNEGESGCKKSLEILVWVFGAIAVVCLLSSFCVCRYSRRKIQEQNEKWLSKVTLDTLNGEKNADL